MRHFNPSTDCSHYAVGHDGDRVLVQLQDERAEQVRISLSIEYARHLIELLEINVAKVEQAVRYNKQREAVRERFKDRPMPELTNDMFGAPHLKED